MGSKPVAMEQQLQGELHSSICGLYTKPNPAQHPSQPPTPILFPLQQPFQYPHAFILVKKSVSLLKISIPILEVSFWEKGVCGK